MQTYSTQTRNNAMRLREQGLTRAEIESELGQSIPKATFAYWIKDLVLPPNATSRLERLRLQNLEIAREAAFTAKQKQTQRKRDKAQSRNLHLVRSLGNLDTAKVALAMLYLGEGSKTRTRAALTFGNSDPSTVRLYLELLQRVYQIDQAKLRGTLQCRADQDIAGLECFWQDLTGIPKAQWYTARVDPRSVGKTTKRPEYKGVCRIDYFSSEVFTDLMETITLLLA